MRRIVLLLALSTALEAGASNPGWWPPPPPSCKAPWKYQCQALPTQGLVCSCVPPDKPAAVRGQMRPHVMVTHVVYAVPGRSSSMAYATGSTIGSSISNASSWKNDFAVTLQQDVNFLSGNGGFKFILTNTNAGGQSSTAEISETFTQGYKKLGAADAVDHDYDEVWFIARPTLDVAIIPDDVYWGPGSATWTLSPNVPQNMYFLYAGELNGHWAIPSNVQTFLDDNSINVRDLDGMKVVDPFVDAPTKDPATDPNRFELVGEFPYVPLVKAGDPPSAQSYDVKHSTTSSTQQDTQVVYVTENEITFGANFLGLASAKLKFNDKFTWTNSSTKKASQGTANSDTITVGQPTFGYSGPTVLRVYEDKLYRTFTSHLDWN